MKTSRRTFVHESLVALSGITALGPFRSGLTHAMEQVAAEQPTADLDAWVERVRSHIPAATHSRYFQTAGIGPCPDDVVGEVSEKLAYQNRSPADPTISAAMSTIEPRLRARLASALGADADEIALTHSTPEGIDTTALYHSLREDGFLGSPVRDARDFRLAIHVFNTEDDVDAVIRAIERRL